MKLDEHINVNEGTQGMKKIIICWDIIIGHVQGL